MDTFSGILLGHMDTFFIVLCVDTLYVVFLGHVGIVWIHLFLFFIRSYGYFFIFFIRSCGYCMDILSGVLLGHVNIVRIHFLGFY